MPPNLHMQLRSRFRRLGDRLDGKSAETPSSKMPTKEEEVRFRNTGFECEWPENYRPNCFHPIDLGDTLCDDRFRIIRKLGYGTFATVWLAVADIR